MKQKNLAVVAAFVFVAGVVFAVLSVNGHANTDGTGNAPAKNGAPLSAYDTAVNQHARDQIDEGRTIFRFDTFGNEAFWGNALQLHKAIGGAENGGIGPGVSPKTALAVGLKVDQPDEFNGSVSLKKALPTAAPSFRTNVRSLQP